jgi:hypothetical protein
VIEPPERRPVEYKRYARAKCFGCTGAFHALRTGSIPVARLGSPRWVEDGPRSRSSP